jgi:Flp pilus assembly protein TadD
LQALRQQRLALGLADWHGAEGEKALKDERWFAARFHFDRLCRLKPDVGHHHFNRAQALIGLGQLEQGKVEYEKALSLSDTLTEPERARAHAELGH